jgi:Uma2 family endonuclease
VSKTPEQATVRACTIAALVYSKGMSLASIDPSLLRGLRRVEYDKLAELGEFGDERVELLYGTVVRMSPKGPAHESVSQRMNRAFVRLFDCRASVRIQSPFAASDGSEPEPDLALVPLGDYPDAHPTSAHLLVEIANSSLAFDRGVKAKLYAECNVPEYWIVNLVDGCVEVYTESIRGTYARVTPYRIGDRIRPLAFPEIEVSVADILPEHR